MRDHGLVRKIPNQRRYLLAISGQTLTTALKGGFPYVRRFCLSVFLSILNSGLDDHVDWHVFTLISFFTECSQDFAEVDPVVIVGRIVVLNRLVNETFWVHVLIIYFPAFEDEVRLVI